MRCAVCSYRHLRFWSRYCRDCASVYRQIVQQWVGGVVPTENFTEGERAEFARRGFKRAEMGTP